MRVVAIVLGAISAFFTLYTVRLLVVTHGLQLIRSGGQGAYIGAGAFPVIALVLGWSCTHAWQRGSRVGATTAAAR